MHIFPLPDELPTEVLSVAPARSLGKVYLDWMPQPGNSLELEGNTYTVLERRHRYQLRQSKYALHKVVLYVQQAQQGQHEDKHLIDGRWVIGDATCRFNAQSELLRCAVRPLGPCTDCRDRNVTDSL